MAYAKGRGHFFQVKQSYLLYNIRPLSRLLSHTIGQTFNTENSFKSPFRKYEYIKVSFGLAQAPGYFQELMTGILNDFSLAIAYLDDIIFPLEHVSHIRKVFKKLRSAKLSMKMSKCNFFSRDPVFGTHFKHHRYLTLTV